MWSEADATSGQLPPSRGVLTKENLQALSRTTSLHHRNRERDIEDPGSTRSTLYRVTALSPNVTRLPPDLTVRLAQSRSQSRSALAKKKKHRINAKGSVTSKSSTETSGISLLSDGHRPEADTWSSFNSDKVQPRPLHWLVKELWYRLENPLFYNWMAPWLPTTLSRSCTSRA
jgi:hypothetical protein